MLEIDRLKHSGSKNGVRQRRGKSANHMDALLKRLEEDRDYWKGEVEVRHHAAANWRSNAIVL